MKRGALWFLFRAGLPAAALSLALRGVAWPSVTETLRGARVAPLLALVAVNGLMMTVKGARLRWLLGRAASLRCCLLAKLTASAMNSVVPFRGGDLARLWMLQRHAGISKTVAAAVAVVESLFEVAALASVALIGARLSHQRWAALASSVLVAVAAGLIALARRLARRPPGVTTGGCLPGVTTGGCLPGVTTGGRLPGVTTGGCLPGVTTGGRLRRLCVTTGGRLRWLCARVQPGFGPLREPGVLARVLAASLTSWVLEILMLVLCARALHLPIGAGLAAVVLLAINVALAVPTAPPGAGAFEGAVVVVLTLAGVGKPAAVAFALLYHLIQVVPVVVAGALVVWRSGLTLERLPAPRSTRQPVTSAMARPSQPLTPTV